MVRPSSPAWRCDIAAAIALRGKATLSVGYANDPLHDRHVAKRSGQELHDFVESTPLMAWHGACSSTATNRSRKGEIMRASFFRRLVGAAMLNTGTYEEVEADRSATTQALAVVVFSSLAAGIGAKGSNGGTEALVFFASVSVIALLAWAAWALMMFEIGAHLLPTADTRVDPGELLRTLGFAATPGLIQVLGALPGARMPVFAVAIVWSLAAGVVAVRQALDYTSTVRAIAVCTVGLTLSLAFAVVLGLLFGPTVSGGY